MSALGRGLPVGVGAGSGTAATAAEVGRLPWALPSSAIPQATAALVGSIAAHRFWCKKCTAASSRSFTASLSPVGFLTRSVFPLSLSLLIFWFA